ncbi:nucleotidyltransferase domain-containing protein [Algoriphagus limi]|uniref:Nucleotidyltransferase family protein n=1 Tax=Algoriphagus limi TaxID=2975273 RepID=A0ABT2G1M9_9BACT|nr:nucleotidyltransferase family protein [Algoriphagus limi]MCS5489161.1 nucleotidyltransferase family protein [Algoriphagus limi]
MKSFLDFDKVDFIVLNSRHRLSLAQIDKLGLHKTEKEDLIQEKVKALAELKQVQSALDQLEASGISFVLLKGIGLSQRIYQDPTFRFSKDLDILVPNREEVIQLRTFLLENGWEPVYPYWVEDLPQRDWYLDLANDEPLVNPETGINIEIHWDLDRLIFDLPSTEFQELIQQNTTRIQVLNRSIRVLSPELELVYLFAHGARHAWFRLKWLVDIIHYPVEIIDQHKFQELLKRFHASHFLPEANELAKFYFGRGIELPMQGKSNPFVIKYAKEQIANEVVIGFPNLKAFLKYLYHHYFLFEKKSKAFKFLFRTIGIRPQDISAIKLPYYWQYFFYRYYSLLRRKIITK